MNEKERVALTSVAGSGGLVIIKGVAGVLSGSLALISEAAHSLVDLVATMITYFAVRISGKPADEEHHYGHGKVESVAALGETALLFLLSGVVAWEAGKRLLGAEQPGVQINVWVFVVLAISVVVDFWRARALRRVGRATSSHALEADALHFESDMWSSMVVFVGLGAVALGYPKADAVAALAVAVFVCIAGWRLGRRTIDTLTDTAPPGAAEQIARIVRRSAGVVGLERLRVRMVGAQVFAEIVIRVARTLPLERVAAIKADLAEGVRRSFPDAEVAVTAEPLALDSETVAERVMVTARNSALPVHHLQVHSIGDKLAVSMDLEVDGDMTLAQAHEIATRLEVELASELGPDVEVETHIEPLQVEDLSGEDASLARIAEVRSALRELAVPIGTLREPHDIRVRLTPAGEMVVFHCYADPAIPVHQAHEEVDALERALRRRFPTIKRVVGHAEPAVCASATGPG